MAKLKANKPTADVLMNSMRAMGYSFEAAIADIVDNSVSAQARNIVLRFPIDPSDCCVAVCDDGIGMNKKELLDAMKYGSQLKSANRSEDDLGRFGLGMKAASLSQCRRLTVASKKDGKLSAYDMIHGGTDIPADIARMSKDELLEKMSHYTFSNSGKAPLEYEALRTYSVESLRYIYTSIKRNHNFVDISALEGKEMPDGIDILTYSFPCQDLSNVGAFHGYNKGIDKDSGSRSSLLWQVGRVLTEMKDTGKTLPRFLLMENVPTLLSQRHKKNFETWIGELSKLGYVSKYYQLNASSFGLPQNRPRLLMISVYVGDDENKKSLTEDYFARKSSPEDVVNDFHTSGHYKAIKIRDLLRNDYRNPIWFEEAVECTPNDTVSRRKIWEDNPQIVLEGNIINPEIDTIRTITTKQDRNPNSGNLYFDSGIEGKGKFRYLTPRECMLFMGFKDTDYWKLKNNNVAFHKGDQLFSRDKIIRMAGNSIPVKLLEGVFWQILQIDKLMDKDDGCSQ